MCIRNTLFQNLAGITFEALVTTQRDGVLSGIANADALAAAQGVDLAWKKKEGDDIVSGDAILAFTGSAEIVAAMEEGLIGTLAKFSGIASAARKAVDLAAGRADIVSGSWKKMPAEIKTPLRQAVATGGARFRISDTPMIYLDKNYIRMLGSIPAALAAASPWPEHVKVVQIRGQANLTEVETVQALENGAAILMVDTGIRNDLAICLDTVKRHGKRDTVRIAFGGDVRIADIPALCEMGCDIICIGKEIVDARLLDMKLDVIAGGKA